MTTPIDVFPRTGDNQSVRYARPPSQNLNESVNSNREKLKRIKEKLIQFIAGIVFILGVFFLVKIYFFRFTFGIVELIFCSWLVVLLLVWGCIIICETIGYYFPDSSNDEEYNGYIPERHQMHVSRRQPPARFSARDNTLDTPPSYNLVAVLSPKDENNVLHIIETPPPSYEKVSPESLKLFSS